MPGENKTFYYFSYKDFQDTSQQDTTRQDTIPQDTTPQDTIPRDTSSQTEESFDTSASLPKDTIDRKEINQTELNKLDTITRAEEDSSKTKARITQQEFVRDKTEQDTISVLYQITGATEIPVLTRLKNDPSYVNFMYNIPSSKPDSEKVIYKHTKNKQETHTEQPPKPKLLETESQQEQGADWISFLIIALLIFLGSIRLLFKRYFNTLFKSFHFINYAEELFNEKSSFTIRGATFLNSIYFVVLGLFTLQVVKYFFPSLETADYKLSLLFCSFFIIWYIWNALFKQFIGWVFQKPKVFTEYFYNYNIYRKIAGLVIFPIFVINQYISEEFTMYFIYAGIFIFAILYLMHILRGLQIFMKNKVSISYLILYLCALEFLPILVLCEWIINEF